MSPVTLTLTQSLTLTRTRYPEPVRCNPGPDLDPTKPSPQPGYNIRNRAGFAKDLHFLLGVLQAYAGSCPLCTAVFATAPQQASPPAAPTNTVEHHTLCRVALPPTHIPAHHTAPPLFQPTLTRTTEPQHFASDDGTFALRAVSKPKARVNRALPLSPDSHLCPRHSIHLPYALYPIPPYPIPYTLYHLPYTLTKSLPGVRLPSRR